MAEELTIEVVQDGPDLIEVDDPIDVPEIIEVSDRIDVSFNGGLSIQAQIDASRTRGIVWGKPGLELVGGIEIPNRSGLKILGNGNSNHHNPAHTLFGSVSLLQRDNSVADDVPVITVRGTNCEIGQFSIQGDTLTDQYGTNPDVTILVPFDAGLGSGKHYFHDLNLYKGKVAFQAGLASTDSNCDLCRVERCKIENHDVAFRAVNNQAQGWFFKDNIYEFFQFPNPGEVGGPSLGEPGTGVVFDLTAQNAKFYADGVTTVNPVVCVRLAKGAFNAGQHIIRNFASDAQAGAAYMSGVMLVQCLPSMPVQDPWQVRFDNPIISGSVHQANGAHLFEIRGSGAVDVYGGMGIEKGTVLWNSTGMTTHRQVVSFYGHRFRGTGWSAITDVFSASGVSGIYVNCFGCRDEANVAIPNVENLVWP